VQLQELLKAPGRIGGCSHAKNEDRSSAPGNKLGANRVPEATVAGDVNDNAIADDEIAEGAPDRATNPKAERIRLCLSIVHQRPSMCRRDGVADRHVTQRVRHHDHHRGGMPCREDPQHLGYASSALYMPVHHDEWGIDLEQGVDRGVSRRHGVDDEALRRDSRSKNAPTIGVVLDDQGTRSHGRLGLACATTRLDRPRRRIR
jgi:hypothetical protein